MLNREPYKTIVKDYTHQYFQEPDDEDFEVKTLREDKIVDSIPGIDEEQEFSEEMFNIGDSENLPDSDRVVDCQTRGIKKKVCFGK